MPLIEDVAEAIGNTYKGQLVGTFGDFGTGTGGAYNCSNLFFVVTLKFVVSFHA